ncbi:hypothetical protein [Hyalangium sp.]|uniref:hypothetical protein n=1 Tax=Hyalangium sp. TaxID=2028555 RepID=UPI002D79D21E|nr:hypothetical protein [Hyalangium sp.]
MSRGLGGARVSLGPCASLFVGLAFASSRSSSEMRKRRSRISFRARRLLSLAP